MVNKGYDVEDTIAIVGMACRFPGADTVEEYWNNIENGVSSISEVEDEILRKKGVDQRTIDNASYVKVCGEPKMPAAFDAGFFGISPDEAKLMDPQHRVFLECAWQSIESANIKVDSYEGRFGVFGGVSMPMYWVQHLDHLKTNHFDLKNGDFSRNMFIGLGNDKSYACSRIAHKLNLNGPCVSVDAACATSIFAIHLACKALLDYECDAAVAGGAKIAAPAGHGYIFDAGSMYSPSGKIRAFDEGADGTVFTSGAGVITLKRLETALEDGDEIHALIRGSAINNDGADKMGFSAPSISGQRRAIVEAQAMAGVKPEEVSYIEAHGTGTPMGDPIEISALKEVFGSSKVPYCAIGTVKPNVGHMEAAAGVAGIIKAVLAMKHKKIPQTLNFSSLNKEISLENSPFHIADELRQWESNGSSRIAGVSSFGVGGNNGHVVLQEYNDTRAKSEERRLNIILSSAKTENALDRNIQNLSSHLAKNKEAISDVAYTSSQCRVVHQKRSAFVCEDSNDELEKLRDNGPKSVFTTESSAKKSVRFMFPGQGAQHKNMVKSLYNNEAVFSENLNECAELFRAKIGVDLLAMIFNDDTSDIRVNETRHAQPLLFSIEYSLACTLVKWGVRPDAMIGHSIGEYVCACLSGVMELEDAIFLISERGRLMYSMPSGDMLSVALSLEEFQKYDFKGVDIAAINAPKLIAASGSTNEILAATSILEKDGVNYQKLHTSHAFHSYMMEPILDEFETAVETIELKAPTIPFISNLSGDWITDEEAVDPGYWVRHLRSSVNFSAGIQALISDSENTVLLEVGPGQVLTQLAKKQNLYSTMVLPTQGRASSGSCSQRDLYNCIAKLWCEHVDVDWESFYQERRLKTSLPVYSFDRTEYITPIQMSQRELTAPDTRQDLDNWFYASTWKRSVGIARPSKELRQALSEKTWLVFSEEDYQSRYIIQQARGLGARVICVTKSDRFEHVSEDYYQINPETPSDYQKLIDSIKDRNISLLKVVHMWSVGGLEQGEVHKLIDSYDKHMTNGFYSLLYLSQALDGMLGQLDLDVITQAVHDVLGGELVNPIKASVIGLCKTIPLEFKTVNCRHLDIGVDPGVSDCSIVFDLLVQYGDKKTTAVRNGFAWYQSLEKVTLNKQDEFRLKDDGVYLITGGLGGVGLAFANHLASKVKARLVLTGRSEFPPREQWQDIISDQHQDITIRNKVKKLLDLENMGSEILVVSGDVTKEEDINSILEQCFKVFGKIDGVMHSAGVAGDGIIQLKTKTVADAVIRPKVLGALHLISGLSEYFSKQAPDFFVLNSSTYSVTSGIGQVDYASANSALNKVAVYAQEKGLRVQSLAWGPWEDLGMTSGRFKTDTSGDDEWLHDFKTIDHPLLKGFRESQSGGVEFALLLDDDHWLFREHKVAGQSALPGTAIFEIVSTASKFLRDEALLDQGLKLENVAFFAPVTLNKGPRKLIVKFTRLDDGPYYAFSLYDKEETTREFIVGKISPCRGKLNPVLDIEASKTEFDLSHMEFARAPQEALPGSKSVVSLGRRWESIAFVDSNEKGAFAKYVLPVELSEDLRSYSQHPALLDLATGIVNIHWMKQFNGNDQPQYLPAGYRSVEIFGNTTATLYSINRLDSSSNDQSIVLDVDIFNDDGRKIISVCGFRLARVQMEKFTELSPPSGKGRKENLSGEFVGISVEEGTDAFERVIAQKGLAEVVISPMDIDFLIHSQTKSSKGDNEHDQEVKSERPALATRFKQPSTEAEKNVADVLGDLLGLDSVGVDDDFFELGGDSLIATRFVTSLREAFGYEISLQDLFSAPTVGGLAEHINVIEWANKASSGEQKREAKIELEVGSL